MTPIKIFLWNFFYVGSSTYLIFAKGWTPWWYVLTALLLKSYHEIDDGNKIKKGVKE